MKKNLDVVLDKLKLKDGEIRLLYEVISGTFQCVGFVPLLSQDFKSFSNPQAKCSTWQSLTSMVKTLPSGGDGATDRK